MFEIENNGVIKMTRGDTASLPVFINVGTFTAPVRYELTADDELYLGVMEPGTTFETAILRKKYNAEDLKNPYTDNMITFESEDTINLLPGKYFYSIKLRRTDPITGKDIVDTLISMKEFFIFE